MNRKKRTVTSGVCALIMGMCAIGYGQAIYLFGADVLPDDPNDPASVKGEDPNNVWEPAEHLSPRWMSVSLTSQIYNPAQYPDRDPHALDRSIYIRAEAEIIDTNGLVGFSTWPSEVFVLDQDGDVYYQMDRDRHFSRRYSAPTHHPRFGPGGISGEELRPYSMSVTIPIDPNAEVYPLFFSQVDWLTHVLVTQRIITVDIPFEETLDWFELTPGLELLVEKATAEGTKYAYTIKARYNRDSVSYSPGSMSFHRWADDPLPQRIVMDMQMLNADGKPVGKSGSYSAGSSTSASGSDGQMLATSSGTGSCADCGQVTTIRYRIAVEPYEKEVRFVLEDIPVPSF